MVRVIAICLAGTMLFSAWPLRATAQELAAPDLERAAAAEVRRREAAGSLRRDGTPRSPQPSQHTVIVHDEWQQADQQARGLDAVARSVNGELTDVARALRRLDQSYAVRGFQGCAAATAGSVFVDWRAKGVRPQDRHAVLPPEPIVLGRPKATSCCPTCVQHHFAEGTLLRDCLPIVIEAQPPQNRRNIVPPQRTPPCCGTPALPRPAEQLSPTPIVEPAPASAR